MAEVPERPPSDPIGRIGRRLGEFVLRHQIAEGGFGEVYRAEQPALAREAVVKLLKHAHGDDPEVVGRFMREAQLASRLDHPYAAHIYAFGAEPDGLMWIAMELVRGTTLDRLLHAQGRLPLERLVPLLDCICEVVHTAHEAGIVHRDLKPANVMVLQRAGRLLPKLVDFGIAKLVESTRTSPTVRVSEPSEDMENAATIDIKPSISGQTPASLDSTRAGRVMGSPPYMAPELWRADDVDARTDQYALAVLTYEALTGRLPWEFRLVRDLRDAHVGMPFPPLGDGLEPALDAVLARGAAKQPADRYPDVLAFAAAVRSAAGLGHEHEAVPPLPAQARAIAAALPSLLGDAVALIDREGAHGARHARDAVFALARAAARWLGVLALASSPPGAPPPAAASLLDELQRGDLDDEDWMALARALAAAGTPALPELANALGGDGGALAALVKLAGSARGRGASDEAVRELMLEAMPLCAAALTQLAWLAGYRLTTDPVRADGRPFLVRADGTRAVDLWPLAQLAPPATGARDELFLYAGTGRGAALLVSLPHGFERHDPDVDAWLRRRFPPDAVTGDDTTPLPEPRPYLGLVSFTSDDAHLYFGREREVEECANRLRLQPLLVVVGPSGAGKSSFVHAGLVPALPAGWRTLTLRPGHAPLALLASRLAQALGHRDPSVLAADLAADPSSILAFLASATGPPLTLIIDQAEELFTLCSDATARANFAAALAAATSEARVVCTVRDDFLVRFGELPGLRQRCAQSLQILSTPDTDELLRIVREPARRAGYTFDDPELPVEMVRAVAEKPGALALLSFTAAKLWDARDPERRLLLRTAYARMGGVGGALGKHADETLARLSADDRGLVREAFRHLVTAEGTRARCSHAELIELLGGGDRPRAVLDALTAARLLVTVDDGGADAIEVIHEALLAAWPRALAWRHEDAEGARLREQLRDAARRWEGRGRSDAYLLRGEELADLAKWRARGGGALTTGEDAFATASLRAAARSRLLKRALVGATVGALAIIAGVFFLLADRAEQRTALAESRRDELVLQHARNAVDHDPTAALAWLKLYARSGHDWQEVQTIAVDAWSRGAARRVLRGHENAVWQVAFSPDGRTLASGSFDYTVRLWNLADGTARVLAGHTGEINGIAFSPDGRHVASASDDHTVRVWDVATGAARVLSGQRSVVTTVAFFHGAHGDRLASAGTDGVIRVWDAGGNATLIAHGEAGNIQRIAIAPDDRTIASGGEGRDVWLWDVDGAPPRRLAGHPRRVTAVAFSPDGKWLASVDIDGNLRLWDRRDGSGRVLGVQPGAVRTLVFSPDAQRLATANYDESVALWELDGGKRVLRGHQGPVYGVAFSPDGQHLASGGADRRIRLWDLPPTGRTLAGFRMGQGDGLEFAPDGQTVAYTAGPSVRLARVADGSLRDLAGGAAIQRSARFAPGGRQVAALDEDGRVRVWDLDGGGVQSTAGPSGGEVSLDFSADGSTVLFPDGSAVAAWRWRDGARRRLAGPRDPVRFLRALPDGRVAAVAGNELWVWDGDAGRALGAGTSYIAGLEAAPDGRVLATGDHARTVELWDPTSGVRRVLAGHAATVVPLAFSPDGRRLVSGANDKTVRVWDVPAGTSRVFAGHRTLVRRVAIAPDGSFVVSSGNDDFIRTWDLPDGSTGAVASHVGAVSYLALAPDGRLLASAGVDGTVRLWDTRARAHVPADPEGLRRWLADATAAELADVQ
jgi:WD40 repeat protein/serine/threonine protein kinase